MRALQKRVAAWVISRIGADHMQATERAMRLFEEATELLQAEGVQMDLALRQVYHVYGRPPGRPIQEAAGVSICLLAWCESRNVGLEALAAAEIERIEAKPLDQIRGSLARKSDADLVTVVESEARAKRIGPWEREQ